MSTRPCFLTVFVLMLFSASAGYGEPGTIMLDFDKAGDVNTEPGFTSFLMSDSGTEVNGITIDLAGDMNDARRVDPNSNNTLGMPIYTEEVYRDFVYGIYPSGITIILSGLGVNQECDITIYAFDSNSAPTRIADWAANGDYLLTSEFEGGDVLQWPSPWWYPSDDPYEDTGTTTADKCGTIILKGTMNGGSAAGEAFAFVNALIVAPKGTYIPPPYAQHPVPFDGGEGVATDVNLQWNPGEYADTHDVYFGTDFDDVNDANRSNPLGVLVSEDQPATIYNPAGELDFNTTYYWRIDEVNDPNIWKGKVWSFTTRMPALIASNPMPVDGAQRVLRDVTLSWEEGEGVEKHDVYLGTDFDDVNDANRSSPLDVLVSQNHPATTYSPDLDFNTTYYWRIDEINSANFDAIFKGNVWSFTTYEPTRTWRVDGKCFENGDLISVKDPSIVYAGGKWHLFYTYVGDGCLWCLGYASATTIAGLNDAGHTSIQSTVPGFAPQVFWFEPQGLWYLTVSGANFSTNTDINDVNGWTYPQSMGSFGGLDTSCISDGNNMYFFSASDDGDVLRRSTTVEDFPYNWSEPTIVATDTFEGVQVYKSLADGKFYMMIEDLGAGRYYELWTAESPGGTWTKVEEEWAHRSKFVYFAEHWTDQASHGELLRAGRNERMEISDIDRCQFLIQGVLQEDYISLPYSSLPYELGIIRQSIGAMGDLDRDYDVDSVDYAILASQWLQAQPPGVYSADFAQPGGDGIVDVQDLALMADNWLWGK